MKQAAIERTLRAIRKNYSFGVPVIFDGRCVQAWPEDTGRYTVKAGCYSEVEGLPEYEALVATGAAIKTTPMGSRDEYITFGATLTETQMVQYLAAADGADPEK